MNVIHSINEHTRVTGRRLGLLHSGWVPCDNMVDISPKPKHTANERQITRIY